MRILQINCVFDAGSTGHIVADLHRYYQAAGYESFVLYGRGAPTKEPNVQKCATELGSKLRNGVSRLTGNLYGYAYLATARLIQKIRSLSPDVVHLHCINGHFCNIYRLVAWLRDHRILTVLTLHAEFMYTANCGYAFECEQWRTGCHNCPSAKASIGAVSRRAPARNFAKMHKAFDGFGDTLRVVGVSAWPSERATASAILGGKTVTTVLNGLDERIFLPQAYVPQAIAAARANGEKCLLYVTPYFEDENKGGQWVLTLAERLNDQNVHIFVAGKAQSNYTLPNITFLGSITSPTELASYYTAADLCLLTSRRETFSMVTAESLCCGTPVVGFRAGAPERIALPEYSEFVPYGDIEALKAALMKWLERPVDRAALSEAARKAYSTRTMAENYLSVYQELLESIKNEQH